MGTHDPAAGERIMEIKPPTIAVLGDVIVDHHLYEGERASPTQLDRRGVRLVQKDGGAATLAALIAKLVGPSWTVVKAMPGRDLFKSSPYHAYAHWRPYPEKDVGKVWRATLLGYGEGVDEFVLPKPANPKARPDSAPETLRNGGIAEAKDTHAERPSPPS